MKFVPKTAKSVHTSVKWKKEVQAHVQRLEDSSAAKLSTMRHFIKKGL